MSCPPKTFRNSSVSDFIICPAKYYFGWERNLEPIEKSIDLEYGSSVHLGCESFFKSVQAGGSPTNNSIRVKALSVFVDDFNKKDFSPHPGKNVDVGIKLFDDLFSKYYDLKPKDILAVEKRFVKRIKGFDYSGKIDLLIRQRGRVVITDHKTAGRIGARMEAKWQLARQFIGYKWLTNAEDVQVNLFHCIKGNGFDKIPMVYQIPLTFSPFKLERWEHQTVGILDDIASRLYRLKAYLDNLKHSYVPDMLFPRLGTMCNIYGCEFEPLCSQDLPITEIITPDWLFREREEA